MPERRAARHDTHLRRDQQPLLQMHDLSLAAGCLLVTEAGGLVSDLGGENGYVKTGHVCAGNPDIHGHLLKLIAPHLTDGLKATKV